MERIDFKLFSHTDLDGYSCNILIEELPMTSDCTNVNYDKINEVIKKYITSGEYKRYETTFITDISVNEELAELINNTKDLRLKLIDHHSTALWLNKYSWACVQIKSEEEKTCGTELFFKYIKDILKKNHSEEDINRIKDFVKNVKRYDTWLWKEKYDDDSPKKLNDLFQLLGYERFKEQIKANKFDVDWMIADNKLLLDIHQEKIDRYIESKNKEIISFKFDKYYLGVVFAEQFHSELGNKLSELNLEYDAIAIVNNKAVSYRTIKDNVNCADIAKLLGGGGHIKASGSPIDKELKMNFIKSIFRSNEKGEL